MPFSLTLPHSPVFWLLLAATLGQLWYAAYYFGPFAQRPPEARAAAPGPDTAPVSVVVCARNELDNLRRLLPLLLRQDYPADFEVVLVDDRSYDDTQLYAQQLAQYYPGRFRLVTVGHTPANFAPKKYALTLGIKAARHEHLLFTDADCIPATNQWLRLMQRGFAPRADAGPGADLVLGFAAYAEAPGWLNRLVRYETLLTAAQYLSFAWRGRPYMGVGRNLAYTRATFRATKGFARHMRRLSGDDDLLVQEAVAAGRRAAVVAQPAAHTFTEAPATWAAWWRQKRRHLSAGPAYRPADRRRIGLFMGANMFYYIAWLGLPLFPQQWVSLVLFGLARTLFVNTVYSSLSRRLQQPYSAARFLLLDATYFFFYLVLGVSVFLNRRLRWK